jgi:pre-mRNA cleavage complex 2 protein Pcf11
MGASIEESNETAATSTLEEDKDPSTFTVPADESRDRCVVCGINFKMFFDNDDGIYKYSNAKEIEVLNDEAALKESEEMLVHVTCWRALGSPQVLTPDLALVDTMQNT